MKSIAEIVQGMTPPESRAIVSLLAEAINRLDACYMQRHERGAQRSGRERTVCLELARRAFDAVGSAETTMSTVQVARRQKVMNELWEGIELELNPPPATLAERVGQAITHDVVSGCPCCDLVSEALSIDSPKEA